MAEEEDDDSSDGEEEEEEGKDDKDSEDPLSEKDENADDVDCDDEAVTQRSKLTTPTKSIVSTSDKQAVASSANTARDGC